MRNKLPQLIGVAMIIVSLGLITVSYYISSILFLMGSILILLVSIISLFLSITIDMFRRDKVLDLDALKQQGLTITECKNCKKKNVLEDIYCIFCGDLLGEQHE